MIETYVTSRRSVGRMTTETSRAVQRRLWHFWASTGQRDWRRIRTSDIARWVHDPAIAPLTRKQRLATVRPFFRWLAVNRHIDRDPCLAVEPPKVPPLAPRALPLDEVAALIAAAHDPRDRLIVLLMVQEGLRCCEVVRAMTTDVDLSRRAIGVRGKGGHGGVTRTLPLSDETVAALAGYYAERGRVAGPLIASRRDPHAGVSAHHVSKLVARLMRRAGVKLAGGDGRSAHACRHTMATDLVDAGADLLTVQQALGHAQIQTTQTYLRGVTPDLRTAMAGRVYCRRAS